MSEETAIAAVATNRAEADAISEVEEAYAAAQQRIIADRLTANAASTASFKADQAYANVSFAEGMTSLETQGEKDLASHRYVRRFEHAAERDKGRDDDAASLLQGALRQAQAVRCAFYTMSDKVAAAPLALALLQTH